MMLFSRFGDFLFLCLYLFCDCWIECLEIFHANVKVNVDVQGDLRYRVCSQVFCVEGFDLANQGEKSTGPS